MDEWQKEPEPSMLSEERESSKWRTSGSDVHTKRSCSTDTLRKNGAAKPELNSDFAAFPFGKTCADTANEQEASQGSLPAKNQ